MMNKTHYIGRFAPSPSGDLHFGSLIAALGSFLHARSQNGCWLVRIEDIDPPREVKGAAQRILNTLERYGLYWDQNVLWQSQRGEAYKEALFWLQEQGYCYYCDCRRNRIQKIGGYYDNYCKSRKLTEGAIRLAQTEPIYGFHDQLLGQQIINSILAEEDFIIHRRDGLFAYNLAVVIDDHWQGVTQVVRGADLIEPTISQISLYRRLGWIEPQYMHLPLVLNQFGTKLSKQNHAPVLSLTSVLPTLGQALLFLGQSLPDGWQDSSVSELIEFSINNWSVSAIPVASKYVNLSQT